jgi:hypothetical protein
MIKIAYYFCPSGNDNSYTNLKPSSSTRIELDTTYTDFKNKFNENFFSEKIMKPDILLPAKKLNKPSIIFLN